MKGKNTIVMNNITMRAAVEEYLKERAHINHRNFSVTGVKSSNYEFHVTVEEVEDDDQED